MTRTRITFFSLACFFEESGSLKKIIPVRKILPVVDHMISFLPSIFENCDEATVPKTHYHVTLDEIIQLFDGILQLTCKCGATKSKYYTSNINQQMHLYDFHLKHFKTHKTTPTCFDIFRSSSGSFVVPC